MLRIKIGNEYYLCFSQLCNVELNGQSIKDNPNIAIVVRNQIYYFAQRFTYDKVDKCYKKMGSLDKFSIKLNPLSRYPTDVTITGTFHGNHNAYAVHPLLLHEESLVFFKFTDEFTLERDVFQAYTITDKEIIPYCRKYIENKLNQYIDYLDLDRTQYFRVVPRNIISFCDNYLANKDFKKYYDCGLKVNMSRLCSYSHQTLIKHIKSYNKSIGKYVDIRQPEPFFINMIRSCGCNRQKEDAIVTLYYKCGFTEEDFVSFNKIFTSRDVFDFMCLRDIFGSNSEAFDYMNRVRMRSGKRSSKKRNIMIVKKLTEINDIFRAGTIAGSPLYNKAPEIVTDKTTVKMLIDTLDKDGKCNYDSLVTVLDYYYELIDAINKQKREAFIEGDYIYNKDFNLPFSTEQYITQICTINGLRRSMRNDFINIPFENLPTNSKYIILKVESKIVYKEGKAVSYYFLNYENLSGFCCSDYDLYSQFRELSNEYVFLAIRTNRAATTPIGKVFTLIYEKIKQDKILQLMNKNKKVE